MNEEFVAGVIVDLRAYCADLLHPGALRSAVPTGLGLASSPTDLGDLAFARLVASEVRRVLDERWDLWDADGDPVRTPIPARASAPRDASGWAMTDGRAMPRYWLRAPLEERLDSRHVEWLNRLVGNAAEKCKRALGRLEEAVTDARDNIASDSIHAEGDLEALERLLRDALSTQEAVLRIKRELASRRAASRGLVRGSAAPSRSPGWSMLRELARISSDGGLAIGARLERILTPPVSTAEFPFLYQRWVGLQLIRSLERAGFALAQDPRAALFLGGYVRFKRDHVALELWVESRLAKGRHHPSGLATDCAEVSPDFIFAVPGDKGRDFYILDATLSSSDERLKEKATYRARCHADVQGAIAGWTARRRPIRAWAVAPIKKQVELMSEDGSAGALGLGPGRGGFAHLDAWIGDMVRHAQAWAADAPGLEWAVGIRSTHSR